MTQQRMSNLTQRLRVMAAVLMVSSLGLFYPGAVSNLRAQKPSKARASSPAGGPKEGIKVHGHWTIDIRNPDGKLVTHREFENDLTGFGASILGSFLRRTRKAGEWRLIVGTGTVGSGTGPDNPCLNGTSPIDCYIYEPATQFSASSEPYAFKTLTIALQGVMNTMLAGTATAQRDGVINTVQTGVAGCPVDTQGVCAPSVFSQFTVAGGAGSFTPINVVAGQIIQVTVTISFSFSG